MHNQIFVPATIENTKAIGGSVWFDSAGAQRQTIPWPENIRRTNGLQGFGRAAGHLTSLVILTLQCFFAQSIKGSCWTADLGRNRKELAVMFTNYLDLIQRDDVAAMREKSLPKYANALIADYERAPAMSSVTNTFKAVIAYGYFNRLDKSTELLTNLLQAVPNDQFFPDVLGLIHTGQGDYGQAAAAYEKAWHNGTEDALYYLAGAYLRMDQPAKVTPLVPRLLAELPHLEKIRDVLLAYVMDSGARDRDLFRSITKGVTDENLLRKEPNILPLYILALWKYDDKPRALRIQAAANIAQGYDILTHDSVFRKEVLACFEKQPELFGRKELKVVAKCYILMPERRPDVSGELYRKYLIARPKDGAAWGELGGVNLLAGKQEEALQDLETGWKLRDTQSLKLLAICNLNAHNLERVKQLIPALLEHKGEDIEIVRCLVEYAMRDTPKDKELFLQATKGVDDDLILTEEDYADAFIDGFRAIRIPDRPSLSLRASSPREREQFEMASRNIASKRVHLFYRVQRTGVTDNPKLVLSRFLTVATSILLTILLGQGVAFGQDPTFFVSRAAEKLKTNDFTGALLDVTEALRIRSDFAPFNYPQVLLLNRKPRWMSLSFVMPRHMTMFPGGGSDARLR